MTNSGIYRIFNTKNGLSYIGSSVNIRVRWLKHLNDLKKDVHHSNKLQKAFNKYGIENFKYEVLELCSIEDLVGCEQKYINEFNSYINGYNCTPVAGSPMLGKKHTDETKQLMSDSRVGVSFTEEHKNKLSKSAKNRVIRDGYCMIYDDKRNKKISESLSGRKLSKSHKDNISKNRLGIGNKPILQLTKEGEFIRKWSSITECCDSLGLDNSSVSKVLKGKLKTTGNFKFRYYE